MPGRAEDATIIVLQTMALAAVTGPKPVQSRPKEELHLWWRPNAPKLFSAEQLPVEPTKNAR